MREKRYTAGPWAVDRDDRPDMDWNNHIIGPDENRICFMANPAPDFEKGEANARLVSASPDLLEALEALNAEIDALWNTPPENKYIDGRLSNALVQRITVAQQSALSALAKAYGESE